MEASVPNAAIQEQWLLRTGRVFGEVVVSDHAQALFGDVYSSCPDYIYQFTLDQERRGEPQY